MTSGAGISADADFTQGQDQIDGWLTVDRLAAYGRRLGEAIERDELILFATGHPAALSFVYARIARAVRNGGAEFAKLRRTFRGAGH